MTFRIGYARVNQETNAFSPLQTTIEDFERFHFLTGEQLTPACDLLRWEVPGLAPAAELTGFVQALRFADVEPVPILSAWAMPSGPMTEDTYLGLRDRMTEAVRRSGPLDGVYLALHGSMRARGKVQDPEEGFISAVREVIGDRPLAVSYDLHGLMTPGKVEVPDIVTAYRTNPHWDLPWVGVRAARLLYRTLRGEIRPKTAWRSLPMAFGSGMEVDLIEPTRSIFRRMKKMERDPRTLYLSLFMVHPFTDARNLGWSTVAVTDREQDLAERLADEVAEAAWAVRDVPPPEILDPQPAIEKARKARWARRTGCIFFVDTSDVVGAGGVGDNPNLLRPLVEQARDLTCYVPIRDPEAVQTLWDLPKGDRVETEVGGKLAADHGEPVSIAGRITAKLTHPECGRAMGLNCGHVKLVVTEGPPLTLYPTFFGKLGFPLRKADVVVSKSMFHFLVFNLPWVRGLIPVKTHGTTDLELYRTVKHDGPIHPKDRVAEWRTTDQRRRKAAQKQDV